MQLTENGFEMYFIVWQKKQFGKSKIVASPSL